MRQVFNHLWPSGDSLALTAITLSLPELARRFSLNVVTWEEDGLGEAHGCMLKLPSGRVILAWDLEHTKREIVSIEVDAGDAVEMGLRAFLDEVRFALELSAEQIEPNTEDTQAFLKEAQEGVRRGQARRSKT